MEIRKFLCVALVVCGLAIILAKESTAKGPGDEKPPVEMTQRANPQPLVDTVTGSIICYDDKDKEYVEVFGGEGNIATKMINRSGQGFIKNTEIVTTINALLYLPPSTIIFVGNGGRIYISHDCGRSISKELTLQSLTDLSGITIYNGVIKAIGADGTIISSKDNGETWDSPVRSNTPVSGARSVGSITTNNLYGIAVGNNTTVIVGAKGTILTSSDNGATWTSRTSGTTQNLYAVAFANNTFVAVGYWDTVITSSDNGATWTKRTTNTYSSLYGLTYGNGLFVAVGGGILTSPNGVTWTKRTSPTTNTLKGVSFDAASNTFTAVGAGGAWVTSPDGITWTSMLQGTSNTMLGVTYANNIFAAVGAAGTILTSPDGAAWTQRTSGTTDALSGIAFGNNGFVAVGGSSSGLVLTSSDGISWTNRGSKAAAALADVAYGNGLFAAGGMSGALVTSPDGVNWTARSSGVTGKITGVAYGNGLFAAVAETEGDYTAPSGVILTSADGNTWSKKTFADYNFYGVAYGNSLFVAVGGDKNSQGALLTSPDGVTWTPRTSGTNNLLVGAMYGGGVFMVVGQNGITVTSADGITWTARNSVTKNYLYRAAYGNTAFVAVGYLGTIVRSEGCYSILSTYNLSLHAPYITYNGQSYWADFYYASGSDFTLYNAGLISDASSYSSCAASTLSAEGKLSLPQVNYNGLPYWADFQYTSGLTFTLTVAGQK